ncbi:MAG: hypothetical protein F4X64_02665 [Chloroflexi bacterium]|nr:hypothetical protein [Chloroflexota bacterium]
MVLNKLGLVADWDCNTANVHDQTFQPLLACYDGQLIILVHFNILVQWNGLQPDATGKVRLSIAQFTL